MKKVLAAALGLAMFVACKNSNTEMSLDSPFYKHGSEEPVIDVKPGLQRQLLCYNKDIMLVRVIFGPEMVGQRPAPHTHPHSQSSYILSGKFEFHNGDEVVILGPGDSYCVQPNVPHEAYCLEPGVIIDGFSPIREDFLTK